MTRKQHLIAIHVLSKLAHKPLLVVVNGCAESVGDLGNVLSHRSLSAMKVLEGSRSTLYHLAQLLGKIGNFGPFTTGCLFDVVNGVPSAVGKLVRRCGDA
jgi:hypothetical protein